MVKTYDYNGWTIEKGLPIPEPDRKSPAERTSYPWHVLEVNESFLIDTNDSVRIKGLQEIASRYGTRNNKKYKSRTVRDEEDRLVGIRFWRVE